MGLLSRLNGFFTETGFDIPARANVAVRMEAIGGQGANSAGKVLAEAAVLGMGFTGNHFSSFGSEKRGTPVRSFVRFSPSRKEIRSASSVRHPDLLIVFHESLIESHPDLLEGVSDSTDLLINSARAASVHRFPRSNRPRSVSTIDASNISLKLGCGLNSVLLGAAARLLPEVHNEKLEASFTSFFQKMSARDLKVNLNGFREGLKRVRRSVIKEAQLVEVEQHSALPQLGYLNAPIGGWIINPGNSALKDNSASRKGVLPKLDRDLCFHCGYCDMVCPDLCFVWKKDADGKAQLQGIDYQYCKGCQKCVVACPVSALTAVREDQVGAEERKIKVFPNSSAATTEKTWRTADWSAQVAELAPESRMMTLQTELLDPKSYLKPEFPEFSDRANEKGKLK
jgi:pyruvate ferredoxin oxidoreductase gamma subunit